MRAREALEPVLLRAREARLLDQPPRAPALLIEGIAFDADGRPVEFARTFVRGDRTRYYVERIVVDRLEPAEPRSRPTVVAGLRPGRTGRLEASRANTEEERSMRTREPDRFAVLLAVRRASWSTRLRASRRRPSAPCGVPAAPRRRRRASATSAVPRAQRGADATAGRPVAGQARRRRDPLVLLPRHRRRPEQVQVEDKVADDFNATHPGIHLKFEVVTYYDAAADALSTQLGPATRPDIVGPVGIGGARTRSTASGSTSQPHIDKTRTTT